MVIFYKKWKKYNEILLTKKNGLKYSKNDKSSTLPRNNNKKLTGSNHRCRAQFKCAQTVVGQ